MDITLCMILYNEEGTIDKCIDSIFPLIDKAVIAIDSKTDDYTERIVRDKLIDIPHEIIYFDWENDFAKARNHVLEFVSTEYVLFMDGDETIDDGSLQRLLKLKHGCVDIPVDFDAVSVNQIGISPTGEELVSVMTVRLFKSHLRYKYKIHEEVDVSTSKVIKIPNVQIINRLTSGDTMQKRNEYYVRQLLDSGIEDEKTLFHIASTYFSMGKMEDAIVYFEKLLDREPGPTTYMAKIKLAEAYERVGKSEDALKTLYSCFDGGQGRAEHYVSLGVYYYKRKDFFKCLYYMTLATNVPMPEKFHMVIPVFYQWMPWYYMGKCYREIGFANGFDQCRMLISEKWADQYDKKLKEELISHGSDFK